MYQDCSLCLFIKIIVNTDLSRKAILFSCLESIIMLTADIISSIPDIRLAVKGSLKTNIPTKTAVTGSIAPSIAVKVEPIYFTAFTRVRFDITVGMMANISRLRAELLSGMY